jgi:hypothetical protein
MTKIEEIEARRAARKAELAKAQADQFAADLEALDALEVEHGDGAVARLDLERYVKGQPTFAVLKTPSGAQYKRFCDMVSKAVEKNNQVARRAAQDTLAESCWIYPANSDQRKAMLDEFPGLLVSIAVRATQLVEGRAAEEGKD